MAGFTESSGILPDFPWAERHKAEVSTNPLVLMGGILPPGGSQVGLGSRLDGELGCCARTTTP